MEIKEIAYLLAIVNHDSISAAADSLFISQSALSLFLKNYEDSLGVRLFYRTADGVIPSTEGQVFFSYLKQIADLYQKAQEAVVQSAAINSDRIAFGLPAAKSALYLPQILKEIDSRMLINITEANSSELEHRLLEGRLQIALISGPLDDDTILHIKVEEEEIFLAAPASLTELKKKRLIRYDNNNNAYILPEGLNSLRFILLEKGIRMRKSTDSLFSRFHIQIHETYTVSDVTVALDLVAQGLGYAIIPRSQMRNDSAISYLQIGLAGLFRDTFIVYSKTFSENTLCKELIQMITRAIQKLPNGGQKSLMG